MTFTPGETVGAYRIIEQLGQGGMATVYKAYHASLDRYVAIKVLHQAFHEDKSFHARFEREARVVAKLEHTNIVPIYDYAEHEGRPYLVMKYIEGETLKARMQRGPLTSEEVLKIVEDTGAGLAYAHKRGILHRDVKPSNVILASDGQIYLADFGLARIAAAGDSTLSSDMVLGTPQYISPEQAMGKKELDDGTDIYSFAVMLYEMTVGRVPFSADTPFSIIHDHIYSPLPLPSIVNPAITPDLERVLLKALSKERADRHADIPALVEAFRLAWLEQTQTAETVQVPVSDSPGVPVTMAAQTPPAPAAIISAESASRSAEQVAGGGDAKPPKDGLKTWQWVGIGAVAVIFICCVGIFILLRTAQRNMPNIDATVNAAIITSVPPDIAPTVEAAIATAMPPVLPVDAAKKNVSENPDDPQAHLELVIAYGQADMPRQAVEEMKKVIELGGKDEDFLITAGDELAYEELYLAAAMIYLRLGQLQGEGFDPEYRDSLHEMVYYASGETVSPLPVLFPLEELRKLEPVLPVVVQARVALANGDLKQAREMLDILYKTNARIPEGLLIEAQIAIAGKDTAGAVKLLNVLLEDGNSPDWVVDEAGYLLDQIQ